MMKKVLKITEMARLPKSAYFPSYYISKTTINPVPTKDIKTPTLSLPLTSFVPIFEDNTQCAETNERSILRYLFFELS